jgi:hypothetical protein
MSRPGQERLGPVRAGGDAASLSCAADHCLHRQQQSCVSEFMGANCIDYTYCATFSAIPYIRRLGAYLQGFEKMPVCRGAELQSTLNLNRRIQKNGEDQQQLQSSSPSVEEVPKECE